MIVLSITQRYARFSRRRARDISVIFTRLSIIIINRAACCHATMPLTGKPNGAYACRDSGQRQMCLFLMGDGRFLFCYAKAFTLILFGDEDYISRRARR